jgi:hypothetical protein
MGSGRCAVTAVDLDVLAKLRAGGTRGEWVERGRSQEPYVGSGTRPGEYGYVCTPKDPADAALIVAAVNALEPLLAEVRRGRALRERLEGLAEEWDDQAAQLTAAADRSSARERTYITFWIGKADAYSGTAARLRAALAAGDPS